MVSSIRVIISGRVQGVGFRAWTVATAGGVGLKGWVRNRSDGTVEALFSGEETAIHAMIESCQKGPTAARVDKIESFQAQEEISVERFVAKPTV